MHINVLALPLLVHQASLVDLPVLPASCCLFALLFIACSAAGSPHFVVGSCQRLSMAVASEIWGDWIVVSAAVVALNVFEGGPFVHLVAHVPN